jgi:ring-1,2-phenylacetyl-CoA epoxidase subunit PaaE
MVEDVRRALKELGAAGKIHTELFTTAGNPVERRAVVTPLSPSRDLTEVVVVMDGRRRNFSMPRTEFVLDAAGRAGLELPYSCRAGVCSTCRAKLVNGEITMEQNMALEEWEVKAGYFLCCQARPVSEQIELTYDE